jgi:hypothetical protein
MKLGRRDLEFMEWIGAQYAVREDQLARLMGRSKVTAGRWSRAMREAGYCRREWLLAGDPAWVWLTGRGARMTEQRFRPWRSNVGRLRHIGAVSDLRLFLAERLPDARWICERELLRARPNRFVHVPDAVLEVDSERHALEVELAPKTRKRLVSLVEELRAYHDAVVYVCAPAPARLIEELREEWGWPEVHVRYLTDIGAGGGERNVA